MKLFRSRRARKFDDFIERLQSGDPTAYAEGQAKAYAAEHFPGVDIDWSTAVYDDVRAQVGDTVYGQVGGQVTGHVGGQVRDDDV